MAYEKPETHVVHSDRNSGGGAGWFIAGILVVAILLGAIFMFGTPWQSSSDGGSVSVDVQAPAGGGSDSSAPAEGGGSAGGEAGAGGGESAPAN